MDVRAVNRCVTASGPTGAVSQAGGVVPTTDVDATGSIRSLRLGMATEAEIGIRFGEHFGVDGAVGIMADGAAFAQGGMFVNERPGLLPVALSAGFI